MAAQSPNVTFAEVVDACSEGKHEELRDLLKRLSDNKQDVNRIVNQETENGKNLIHLCIGKVACIRELIENKAKVNLPDKNGLLPLHLAAQKDYVETMMLLIQAGADINETTINDDKKTAIQLAKEAGAQTSVDFLLFIVVNISDNVLDKDVEEKHRRIMKGIEHSKVAVGGLKVPGTTSDAREDFSELWAKGKGEQQGDVIMEIKSAKTFLIQIRRMDLAYQLSSHRIDMLPTDGLISDIYQYKVDREVTCTVKVPVTGQFQRKYYDVIVKQTTEDKSVIDDVDIIGPDGGTSVAVFKMTLTIHGVTPIVAFGVFSKLKSEENTINYNENEDTSVKCETEKGFTVTIPAGKLLPGQTANKPMKVEMQVMPTVEKSDSVLSGSSSDSGYSSEDSSVGAHSAFCTIRQITPPSEQEDTNDLVTITLPRPESEDDTRTVVAQCAQDDNPEEASDWLLQDDDGQVGGVKMNGNTVSVLTKSLGSFFVFNLTKAKSLGYLIKETVRNLYEAAKGDKKICVLFAMIQPILDTKDYLTEIHLCEETQFEERKRSREKDGLKLSELGKCDPVEVHTKTTYMIKVHSKSKSLSVEGPDSLPIMIQGSRPKSQKFILTCRDGNTHVQVFFFKRDVPTKEEDYHLKAKLFLPLMLRSLKKKIVHTDQFCSDQFISRAASFVGDKWYELGIYLGFCFEEMEGLQGSRNRSLTEGILFKWRDDDYRDSEDDPLGLNKLFRALKLAECPKLRHVFTEEIHKYRANEPRLKRWIECYQRRSEPHDPSHLHFDFSRIPMPKCSPFKDEFLMYAVAKCFPPEDIIFIDLGVATNIVMDAQNKAKPLVQRKCHFIHKARNKYGRDEVLAFLKKVMKTLSSAGYNVGKLELSKMVDNWIEEGNHEPEVHQNEIAKLKRIFKT